MPRKKRKKDDPNPMFERISKIEKLAGMCPHGNFPSSCSICQKEAAEKETFLVREKNKEKKEWLASNFEAVGISAPSARHPERNEDAMAVFPGENLAIVADGVGGEKAGDIASRTAVENFINEYAKTKESVSKMTTLEYSQKIKEIIKNSTLYKEDIPQIIKELAQMEIPQEVWREAVTLNETAIALNKRIFEKGQSEPELKGLSTTLTSVKIVETSDKRIFAIFLNVGDSEAYLKRKNQPVERSTVSDSGLETAIASGLIDLPREISRDARKLDDWARANLTKKAVANLDVEKLKFFVVNQALGGKELTEIAPHITIKEVHPGDILMLCSDGISDNDGKRRFEKILERSDITLKEQTETILKGAEEGLKNNEGKGWDDMTVQVLKIKKREEITPEKLYAKWVEKLITQVDLSKKEKENLKKYLEREKAAIAQKALTLIKEGKAKDAGEAMKIIGQEILQKRF
jgi:serine/threonine protein phosphatase PrpC